MTQPNTTKLPLLRSESAAEFLAFRKRLNQQVKPQGVIEEGYLEDFAAIIWEINRLRGLRISTIENAYSSAARTLLLNIFLHDGNIAINRLPAQIESRELAQGWLENDPAVKAKTLNLLRSVGLDESSIEAEAIKQTMEEMQYFDRAIATATARRDKTLRMLMDYRGSDFAARLRQKADQILNEPPVAQPAAKDNPEQAA